MKILELTNFSAGICGVWSRVKEESERLSKLGHNVMVFSSRFTKGSAEIAPVEDSFNGIKIKRYSGKKLGGESFIQWFSSQAFNDAFLFKPEVIIAHSYRHGHTLWALRLGKKIGAKVFLVTHAPFGNENRSILAKLVVNYYDSFFGPSRKLNKFDKIITITKWEEPYLEKLGVKKEKMVYIPNGLPEEFFKKKNPSEENKILFLGRISPIKDLETLILALALTKDKKIKLELVGPAEEDYLKKLKDLIKEKGLENRIVFSGSVYDLRKKISKIDSCKIFVLPSKREAMPQSLIEAMARGKIVISSNNLGSREIIPKDHGFLFNVGDPADLAKKINLVLSLTGKETKTIKNNARKSVEKFNWNKIIKILENEIKK